MDSTIQAVNFGRFTDNNDVNTKINNDVKFAYSFLATINHNNPETYTGDIIYDLMSLRDNKKEIVEINYIDTKREVCIKVKEGTSENKKKNIISEIESIVKAFLDKNIDFENEDVDIDTTSCIILSPSMIGDTICIRI